MKTHLLRNKVYLLAVLLLTFSAFSFAYAESNSQEAKNKSLKGTTDQVKVQLVEKRAKLEEVFKEVKANREEFKLKIEESRGIAKTQIEALKASLKEKLAVIKDDNKKLSAEKILTKIQDLNTSTTDKLVEKVKQIEEVLIRVESRITKAQDRGLDVSVAKEELAKAKEAIANARAVITTQTKKVYEFNTTSDTTLKADLKTLRDNLNSDIKAVYAAVKSAHEAVSKVATTLAQIPKIDDDVTTNTPAN